MELRCEHKLLGIVIEPGSGVVELKCSSRFCGAVPGVVVLHRFSMEAGQLLSTKRYKDPTKGRRTNHGAGHVASVRSA